MRYRSAVVHVDRRAGADTGSAVAEFVMVSTLLIVLGLSIIQLALILHVRNTLTDAASHGARYGALANRSIQDGAERTRSMITQSLHAGFAGQVQASTSILEDQQLVIVTVRTQVPLLGLIPNGWELQVRGQAVRYG